MDTDRLIMELDAQYALLAQLYQQIRDLKLLINMLRRERGEPGIQWEETLLSSYFAQLAIAGGTGGPGQPASEASASTSPAAVELAVAEPAITESAAEEPASGHPVIAELAGSEPTARYSVVAELAGSEPMASHPAVVEPAVRDMKEGELEGSEPMAGDVSMTEALGDVQDAGRPAADKPDTSHTDT